MRSTTPQDIASSATEPLALHGVTVIEMGTVGPVPFCGMLLADMGASVVRIDRVGGNQVGVPADARYDIVSRGKKLMTLDLKSPDDVASLKRLVRHADVLIEGFRPGVMERLGLGPVDLHAINAGLVYGRLTGWGQDGPMAQEAGHDINYLALSGALSTIGPKDGKPCPPLNLVADYAGGSMYLAFGISSALLQRQHTGKGQTIDAAMVDGVASLLSGVRSGLARNSFKESRESNMLDGGAPFYSVYQTSDNEYLAVGCIEARFYQNFLRLIGLDATLAATQFDESQWPATKVLIAARIAGKTRAEWVALAAGAEACVSPVLSPTEALDDPHMRARAVNVEQDGMVQPMPAPRMGQANRQIVGKPGGTEASLSDIEREWAGLRA